MRTEFARLGQIPVPSQMGGVVPLGEVGRFVQDKEQRVIYHKDLQPVEYVIGNTTGRLGAPIYGMLQIEEMLKNYQSPDNVTVQSYYTGVPEDTTKSSFEWAGEWTVTYETFRDMGLAFGVALVLIYMLVVWEFKNFTVPAIVMAPIPLTLIGIVPGHWLMGAEFTATSMIGFIALAGIIVRNSLLLVDFARQEIAKGVSIVDAVIFSCQARTRPILITGAALVLGSSVILFDPIFQGMAVSLMFGVVVSTVLTLVVIPLGCVTVRNSMVGETGNLPCALLPSDACNTSSIQESSLIVTESSVAVLDSEKNQDMRVDSSEHRVSSVLNSASEPVDKLVDKTLEVSPQTVMAGSEKVIPEFLSQIKPVEEKVQELSSVSSEVSLIKVSTQTMSKEETLALNETTGEKKQEPSAIELSVVTMIDPTDAPAVSLNSASMDNKIEVPSVEKKSLSKRPRRGIRIKGEDNS
jgi:hypothetical protein